MKLSRAPDRRRFFVIVLLLAGCSASTGPNESPVPVADAGIGSTTVERGPIKVTVQINPKSARLSDEPKLTISIAYENGVTVTRPPFGESLGDFLILDFHEPLPQTVGDRQVIQQIYTLEPTRAGQLMISPISVAFNDDRATGDGGQHVLETEPLPIEITTMLDAQAPSLTDLRPPTDPVEIARPTVTWPWYLVGAIPVMWLAWLLWRRSRRQLAAVIPQLSPEELARQELDALVARRLDQSDIKEFYVELTGIVRRYIERTTNVRAPEQTTDEFLRATADHPQFSLDERSRLREFLESADLVKYAAFHPDQQDIETAIQRARRFTSPQSSTAAEVSV